MSHKLRKADAVYQDTGTVDMVGTFYAVDGSRLRYDSTGQSTGTLYLPDGTRYIIGASTTQYIDRHGNTLNYDATNRRWTDTLGRPIDMPWPVNPSPGNYSYSLPGVDINHPIQYTLKFQSLSTVLSPVDGQTPALKAMGDYYLPDPNSTPTGPGGSNHPTAVTGAALFTSGFSDFEETPQSFTYVVGRGQSEGSTFNPTVLAEIVLPNQQSYKFFYNIYGEIDKVIYPTGAFERFQYSTVAALGGGSIPYSQGNRGRISRWLSANGTGNDEIQWQYSTSNNPLVVTAPDGTRSETDLWTFPIGPNSTNFGYQDSRHGMVKEERLYGPGLPGVMLRRTLNEYGQSSTTTPKPVPPNTSNPGSYTAYRNPRLTKQVDVVLDTAATDALAKLQTYEYSVTSEEFKTGLDQTAANEYHFAPFIQATAESGAITSFPTNAFTLARRGEVTYLNDSAYLARNILGLPTTALVKNGASQVVSRADSVYDEAGYPLLTYNDLTGADYINPGNAVRGNVTTARVYFDVAAGLFLETHSQFDQCGNVRKTWNERNIQATDVEYSADYKHAFPTQTTTAVPDPAGNFGSNQAFVTTSTFNLATGLPLTNTNINGQVISYSYQDDQGNYDPWNRLRKITRPDGGWTKYTYGDTLGNLFTATEMKQDATRTIKTFSYRDPFGRPTRSFVSENSTTYIAIDTLYDQFGRDWKTSNPYRTTTLDGVSSILHTSNWTTRSYDALGRVNSIGLPDGAVVQFNFQGIYTTVVDEAGRERRQKINALGNVIRVDEPTSSGLGSVDSPNQASYYEYDTKGKLVHVTQGSGAQTQHRYFKYDDIGRLTYERHVEQAGTFTLFDPVTNNSSWSKKLVYDETIESVTYKGHLTSIYDSRNTRTKFRYDQIGRAFEISYTDGTPTVTKKYDQNRATYLNKGELTEASTAAAGAIPATSQIFNYDLMNRLVNHEQVVAGQSYVLGYTYNLNGALTSQTYPSGRVVNYAFDDAARISSVSSGSTVYASQYDYNTTEGLLKSITFGNGTVEDSVYNSRMQLKTLTLAKSGTQLQKYDYQYGVYNPSTNTVDETKNNGRLAQIEGFIAAQKQWQQRFAYDSLGRLTSAREFRGDNGQQSYLVNYEYDVFGNRYQKEAQNSNPFTQVWVESSHIDQTTNRFNANVTYDAAGNIISDSKFRNLKFEYDANNRQKQSSNLDDSGVVKSIYDALGQRVATQVSGSLTNVLVYDAMGKLLAEYNSTTVMGGTQYLFADHQGSPRVVTDSTGTVISRHDYLPFGEELGTVGMRSTPQGYGASDASRKKHAGMERDEVTGLSHTLWRKQDSLSGRWTTVDPTGKSMAVARPQSFNRYAYVNNDPVNQTDPTGLMPGAEQGWQDAQNGFWGAVIPFNVGHFGGPEVIGERMLELDTKIIARIIELRENMGLIYQEGGGGSGDGGTDTISTTSYAFTSMQEALEYYKRLYQRYTAPGNWMAKQILKGVVYVGSYSMEAAEKVAPDGVQLSGSALWVFSGSLTITKDLHVYGSLDTPNIVDLVKDAVKDGPKGNVIKKIVPLSGSATAVYILDTHTSTQERDDFFGGGSLNISGGDGPYGGVTVSENGTTGVMVGVGAGVNVGYSFSTKEPLFKIPYIPAREQRQMLLKFLK